MQRRIQDWQGELADDEKLYQTLLSVNDTTRCIKCSGNGNYAVKLCQPGDADCAEMLTTKWLLTTAQTPRHVIAMDAFAFLYVEYLFHLFLPDVFTQDEAWRP